MTSNVDLEKLATVAIDLGLKVHMDLGPGLLESVYETVLANRLIKAGISVERQKPIPITVDGLIIPDAFRADLLLQGGLLIELKSVEKILPLHLKQLVTYLRLTNMTFGLLMNFGGETFKEGLKRVVNNYVR